MKNLTLFLLSLALLAITTGCEKDEQPPRIMFSSHTEMEKVWNTETFTMEALDNVGVVRIEFFVNGSIFATLTTPPWEVMLDTRTYEDGTITIAAKAYDEEGNMSEETSLVLIIENTLLVLTIQEDYLYEGVTLQERCPIILTASDGSLLGHALMGNGESKVFKRPLDFDGTTFDFSRGYFYSYTDDPDYFSGILYSYMDLKPGEITMEVNQGVSPRGDYMGYCTFSSGDTDPSDYYMLSYGPWITEEDIHTDTAKVSVYENLDRAYFYTRKENTGYYNFYENLAPDQHYYIYNSDLGSNMTPHTVSYPATENLSHVYASADGFPFPGIYDGDNETTIYSEWLLPEQPDIRFHYPTGRSEIQDFYFWADLFTSDDKVYIYSSHGPLPSSFTNIGGDITDYSVFLPGSVQVHTTGSADIQLASLYLEQNNNNFAIYLRGPVGEDMRVPEIPTAIKAQYNIPVISNNNLEDAYLKLFDHSDVDGYLAMANHWSLMEEFTPYYSSGTELWELQYYKYFGSKKGTNRRAPSEPGHTGCENPGPPPIKK